MQLAQVVARALVVLLIAIAVPAASLGANMALRPLPKNPLLFQVPFRGTAELAVSCVPLGCSVDSVLATSSQEVRC
jgi:hypothetical protein